MQFSPSRIFPVLVLLFATSFSPAQSWLERVSATQAAQPHWVTPVATVTPRLEQEFRFDVLHQNTNSGTVTNLDGGKGLELIPTRHTELLVNLPPYLVHQDPAKKDGWGDLSYVMKYRLFARNEESGNAILTAFFGGSIPTGQYKNGSTSAVVMPTLAGGKGWGHFDVQATLGGALPVDNTAKLGRSILSNTAFQYHVMKKLWPEVEINATAWEGGEHDGMKQAFITPGVVVARFPIHHRVAFVAGAGFQIAATHYHSYNHAAIVTLRMPF